MRRIVFFQERNRDFSPTESQKPDPSFRAYLLTQCVFLL
jgi:hypothetical protein